MRQLPAAVLVGDGLENQVYELAGGAAHTRAELAEEVSRQTGKPVAYHDLPDLEYEKILAGFLPRELARIIADTEAKAAEGKLDDRVAHLSRLISTYPMPFALHSKLISDRI